MSKILLGPEQLATTTAPGLMSAADKNKLDTVASDSSGNEYIKGTLYVNCDSSFANGTSVVKATDYASTEDAGIMKIGGGLFIDNLTHKVSPEKANDSQIKAGSAQYRPIVPEIQHKSVFYGLAKAAGDSTQAASSNAVGTYTASAKSAIQSMLGIPMTADDMPISSNDATTVKAAIDTLNSKIKSLGSISSSSSKTFTTSTNGKYLICTIGGGNAQGMWIVNCQSTGTINIDIIYTGSTISASSDTANELKITNGGSTSAFVYAIAFNGSIE